MSDAFLRLDRRTVVRLLVVPEAGFMHPSGDPCMACDAKRDNIPHSDTGCHAESIVSERKCWQGPGHHYKVAP